MKHTVTREQIDHHELGECNQEVWRDEEGRIDRPDGPAIILRNEDEEPFFWEWYRHGLIHRDGAPAQIHHQIGDKRCSRWECWYQDGKKHRDLAPAEIAIDLDSGVQYEHIWYQFGEEHREHGPSHSYTETDSGVLAMESYMVRGKYHRKDGPSCTARDSDTGEIEGQYWHFEGLLHREGGPAFFEENFGGRPPTIQYYRHGQLIQPANVPNPTQG